MSASAIADGLLVGLGAASLFGSTAVSKNSYQVLETTAGSAVMISWKSVTDVIDAFGNGKERHWVFDLHCYIRDTGDPVAVMNRTWTATDLIINYLDSDDTIQGTAMSIDSVAGNNDPEHAYQLASGALWKDFNITPTIREY